MLEHEELSGRIIGAPTAEAQLLTSLRLTKSTLGLLINLNVPVLKDGITRRVLSPTVFSALSASPR